VILNEHRAPAGAIVTRAREALEDGDRDLALDLLAALEEMLDQPCPRRDHRCDCGYRFRWPGELERHRVDCNQAWEAE
jgi:hypothetical protein